MKQAPDFSLPDQNGQIHTLKEYAGKWLVLYFYPKDETPGCTAEACAFRDGREDLIAINAEVVGISSDSVESHKKFADKHSLNFTILADPEKGIIKAYDALNHITRGVRRVTFLIDPSGKIVKDYQDVSPSTHALQIMEDIQQLQGA